MKNESKSELIHIRIEPEIKHKSEQIFNRIGVNAFNIVSDKVYNKVTNKTEDMMLDLIRDNPNITISQFVIKTNLSEPGIKKNLKKLKDKNLIRRVGSNKNGYWEIIR